MAEVSVASNQVFYRTIFLSDIHLGNKDCQAEYLLNFLESTCCTTMYLVGDIIDILALKKKLFWPESHYQVLKAIQKKAQSGTRVIYIPGNHDATLREFGDSNFMDIELTLQAVHTTEQGKKLLVLHGDAFDHAILYKALNRVIGLYAHDFAVFLNRWTSRFRRLVGLPYWSLANYLKHHVSKARKTIENFEVAAAQTAKAQGLDGVVCGHIHKPEIRMIDGVLYCNDGDWTESCSSLVESLNGELHLIHWSEQQNTIKKYEPGKEKVQQVANYPY